MWKLIPDISECWTEFYMFLTMLKVSKGVILTVAEPGLATGGVMTVSTGYSLTSPLLYCINLLILFNPLNTRIKDHWGNKGSCLGMQTALFFCFLFFWNVST